MTPAGLKRPAKRRHFTSTVAPASANFFLIVSASSLETPSFTVFGAPSTRSLASFKPRAVTSRTALMTLILLAPTSLRTTVNSVFSSAGAAPAAAPPPPATTTGAAAAADTPKRDSSFFTSSAASRSDRPTIDSSNCAKSAILVLHFFNYQITKLPNYQILLSFLELLLLDALPYNNRQVTSHCVHRRRQARCRSLQQEQQLRIELFLRRHGGQRLDLFRRDQLALDHTRLEGEF